MYYYTIYSINLTDNNILYYIYATCVLQTDIGFMKDKWHFLPGIFCDLAHSHHPSWCTPDPTSSPSADVAVPHITSGDSSCTSSSRGNGGGSSGGRGFSMVSAGGGLSLRYVYVYL